MIRILINEMAQYLDLRGALSSAWDSTSLAQCALIHGDVNAAVVFPIGDRLTEDARAAITQRLTSSCADIVLVEHHQPGVARCVMLQGTDSVGAACSVATVLRSWAWDESPAIAVAVGAMTLSINPTFQNGTWNCEAQPAETPSPEAPTSLSKATDSRAPEVPSSDPFPLVVARVSAGLLWCAVAAMFIPDSRANALATALQQTRPVLWVLHAMLLGVFLAGRLRVAGNSVGVASGWYALSVGFYPLFALMGALKAPGWSGQALVLLGVPTLAVVEALQSARRRRTSPP